MSGYQLGLYEKSMPNSLSLPDKLCTARDAGYNYLELSIDESQEKLDRLNWSSLQIRDLWLAQQEAGLPIRSICLSGHRKFPMGHPDREIRERSMEILHKAVQLAASLGIRLIQLAGYDVYYLPSTQQTRELFAQSLAQATDYAARYGVILAFETMETPFMDTVEKAMDWVNQIDSPYLQLYPDVGNLTNASVLYHRDVCGDLSLGQGHLAAVHLKESRPGVYREVPFGSGHVDFAAVTRQTYLLGARMFVGEFWYTGQKLWQQILSDNCLFLQHHLDRAFHSL